MKRLLLSLAILFACLPSFAQVAVSGTNVVDNNGNLLTAGKWCFGSNCFTVTNGSFSGAVTAATAAITVTNTSGNLTYLTIPSYSISGTVFNWNLFVVPITASITGIGQPRISCYPGAVYTQTDGDLTVWTCVYFNGAGVWSNGTVISPNGDSTGSGLFVLQDVPTIYSPIIWNPTINGTCTGSGCGGGGGFTGTPNQVLATNASGNAVTMPEFGTSTSGGVTAIAWQEDTQKGIFDPRRPINGDGGVNGSTPAAAWQDVFDEANCWTAENGTAATIIMPAGTWSVGTAALPTLTGGPGINYVGAAGGSGTFASYGATVFNATYKDVPVVQVISPFTSSCPGGGTQTNSLSGGSFKNIVVNGCGANESSCPNTPSGDNGAPMNALQQKGIFVGLTHTGDIGPLGTQYNTGAGIVISGLDVIQNGPLLSYSDEMFLGEQESGYFPNAVSVSPTSISISGGFAIVTAANTFSAGQPGSFAGVSGSGLTGLNSAGPFVVSSTGLSSTQFEVATPLANASAVAQSGATFSNPVDGQHGGIENISGDSRFAHQEVYGFFNTAGPEYGHLCGVLWSGGNSSLDDIFPQLTQIGLCRTYGNGGGRVTNFRIDGSHGAAIQTSDYQNNYAQGYLDGYCSDTTATTAGIGGSLYCDGIQDSGVGGNSYSNIQMARSTTTFPTTHATGDIASAHANHFDGVLANTASPQFDPTYGVVGTNNYGNDLMYRQPDAAGAGIFTGATPNVAGFNHIVMANTTPTNITDLPGSLLNQDFFILLSSSNDILTSVANGGKFHTNSGNNIVGPGYVFFTATTTTLFGYQGNQFTELHDAINANYWQVGFAGLTSLPATDSLATNDIAGNARVEHIPALPNGTFTTAGSSSAYTYCFAAMVYVDGGKQTNASECTSVTPPVTPTSMDNVVYHLALPLNWTRYRIVLQSTTDSTFTPGTWTDVTASSALPQPALADVDFSVLKISPINTNIIPTANLSQNATGQYMFDNTYLPAHSTSPGMPGQVAIDPSGGYIYYATAEDTWSRAPLTFSSSF